MPSSRCCPSGRSRQCRIVSGSSANQSTRSRADQTPTLFTQPPRLVEELTSGHSVTTRRAASGADRVRSSSARPSAAWVVAVPLGVRPMSVGTDGAAAGRTGSRRSRSATCGAQPGRRGAVGEPRPRGRRIGAGALRELAELGVGELRGVVLRVPLAGQPVALHGVGEDHRGAAVVDRRERLAERGQVVPAQVAHRGVQGRVVQLGDQRGQLRVRRRGAARAAAPGSSAAAAGTPGWTCRRSAGAARRRRAG